MREVEITDEILKGNIVAVPQKDIFSLKLTPFALKSTYTNPNKIREEDKGKRVIRIGDFNEQEKQIWASYMARNKATQ